jgi:CRP-like cAMP-binding protein
MSRKLAKAVPARLKENRSFIHEIDILKGLGPEELASFFVKVELRHYSAGSMIFSPGDSSSESLYILKEGRVARYRLTVDGKRLVTRHVRPGAVFGVLGLMGRAMQGNFAEAAEDSSIYVIARQHVLAFIRKQPEMILRILALVANRLRQAEEYLLEAHYSPVIVRLAHFLLANADPDSGVLANCTHEEIGNTIGAVRQTVTGMLGQLRRRGLIETRPMQIRILRRGGLEEMAQVSGR